MSREKNKKVVFTFHSTTQAMKMEEVCKKTKTAGRLIPAVWPGWLMYVNGRI
jgi:hypothetical protein